MRCLLAAAWLTACTFHPGGSPGVDGAIDAPVGGPVDACAGCPVNDVPGGATPITGTVVLTGDLTNAHDDIASSCGVAGGRDLFYELHVATAQVIYVDTIASSFDATLSLFAGPCTTSSAELACVNDPCAGSKHAQLARSLAAGTYCLVVDQGSAATGSALSLSVLYAGRDGSELTGPSPWTASGDTCTGTDVQDPSCENLALNPGTAKDLMYWFTECPGTHAVHATTCSTTSYDSIVYIRTQAGERACVDDGCGAFDNASNVNANLTGNGLYMVVVDGWNGDCGTFTLTVTP
jgi:hypothetical protein